MRSETVGSLDPLVPAATSTPSTVEVVGDLPSPTRTTLVASLDPDVLTDISMTSIPTDVIVPTSGTSLDEQTNPINGRRGGRRPLDEEFACLPGTPSTCLARTLDMLGFDVTSGSSTGLNRRVQRATAVVQLDAGLEMTGAADDELFRYLGIDDEAESRPDETRQIGTSSNDRPIMAMRYGDGPKTVLVVGETHGDEEAGRRVVLRALSLALPDGITLWVIPTMNPYGNELDTRWLPNGADPNRQAPIEREQQAVYDFALAVQPSLTVWYHQNYGWVGGSGASIQPAKMYQEMTGLGTLKRSGDCARGFMWCPIDLALGSSSILVELPDVVTPAQVQIHATALLTVASD
jgi:hypothetical protein